MSTEPWYKAAAKIHSASEREEFIRGVFGFSKPKHDPLAVAGFTLGVASLLRPNPNVLIESDSQSLKEDHSYIEKNSVTSRSQEEGTDRSGILSRWQEMRRLKKSFSVCWPEIEEQVKLTNELVVYVEYWLRSDESKEWLDLLPNDYQVNLRRILENARGWDSDLEYLNRHKDLLLKKTTMSVEATGRLELILKRMESLSNKWISIQNHLKANDELRYSYIKKNAKTPQGKRLIELIEAERIKVSK